MLTIDGKEYATREVHNAPLPREPMADTLGLGSLSGIVDYCKALALDGLKPEGLLLHVESHRAVSVRSGLFGENRRRDAFVRAELQEAHFAFDAFHPHTAFIIGLQSGFMDYGDRAAVLKAVGTIRDEAIKTSQDDGVTQKIVAAVGVALVAEMNLPNPVVLKPYRTFLEVEQPPSAFVLRVQAGRSGALPECALFTADGNRWEQEARLLIREYLGEKLPGFVVIA